VPRTKYPKVGAAEKYAEIGENRPLCDCHGVLMMWGKHDGYPEGGYWACGVNRRQAGRDHYRNHFRELQRELKINAGATCVSCGYDKSLAALHWHHRDPSTKKFRVSMMQNIDHSIIRAEAEKCDLVCANCHAEIHYGVS
jgi:hypothetical protein